MNLLWVLIGLMVVVALALLVLPLIRSRQVPLAERKSYDVAIYKDQLREAERDHERGLLSDEQIDAVKTELQRKLLTIAGPASQPPVVKADRPGPRAATAAGLVLFVGLGSVALYSHQGTPALNNMAYASRDIDGERQRLEDGKVITEMSVLIDRLEKKLEVDTENVQGWQMLGRSLVSIGQFERAVKAYEQVTKRDPENGQVLVDYAEAVIFMNDGRVTQKAQSALEKAQELNAANPKARYYLALQQAQAGNMQAAIQGWIDLLAISLPDAPWIENVRTQLTNAASEAKVDLKSVRPTAEALRIGDDIRKAARAQATAPGPSQSDVEAAAEMSDQERQQMILSMVNRLAERLRENPDDREGWLRLANAYKVLGETDKSREAMERARQLAE